MGKAMLRHSQRAYLIRRGRQHAFPFVYVAILLSLFTGWFLPAPIPAAAQPTGYQEYYVLGYEEHVWRAFLEINDDPDPSDVQAGKICSTVSLVATADYQVVYYDHWEDGYEADLLKPVQSTTRVYGDGDTGNGGTGNDVLRAGEDISLTSDRDITGTTIITGYVPVGPARNPADLRYDGGDRIISSGGPVDLVHAMWPLGNSWIGGAWEVYSRQTYADAHSYHLPIGENLYKSDAGSYGDFRNIYLQLGAFEDNTTVSISNDTDVVNLTLDRGQTYSSMGYINSTSAPTITINAGTAIRSNKPVQVGLVTGADGNFQGRFLVVLPDQLWGGDYVVPVPSGDPGEEAEVYLSNPNDFPITVNAYDRITQTTFVISPTAHTSATVPYSQKRGGSYVPADSAARFTSSDGVFGVVVCADTSSTSYDWGFSGVPSKYLTRDYYVSWAPGDYNTPPQNNGSPVWVTPLTDGTTFYVDFSPLDGVVDQTFTFDVLQQQRIFDPDNDNTGMHVWATGEFAITWGEDPREADPSDPYLDLGVAMLPLQQRWLDPVLTLDKTAEPSTLSPAGGAVTFTLVTQAYDSPLVNVSLTDTLPISWTYVPNSTHVTYSDNTTEDPEPTIDDQTLFWDLSADLGAGKSLTLTFQAQITTTGSVGVSAYDAIAINVNRGEAVGQHQYSDTFFNPSDEAVVYISPLSLVKSVSSAETGIGDTLVYTLSYANTSPTTTITNVILHDVVPIQHVTFQSASSGYSYNPASGAVTWTLETLAPGVSDHVTFTATVNDFVEDSTVVENVGYISSHQTVKSGSNHVRTTVIAPAVKFTKSGPTAATRGQAITYTLYYENLGGAQATEVTIRDTLPVSTTYVSGSLTINTGSGWITLTDATGDDQGAYISPTLTITPGVIAAGEKGWIRYNVQINDNLPAGSRILNWATLDRDLDIPRESNLAVTRISNLLINKAAEQTTVAPGGLISYTLTYENASETITQTKVYMREPIPAYTSLIPGTVYGGDQVEYSWDNGATWATTLPITPVTHIRWYDAQVPNSTQVTAGFATRVNTTLPPDTTIQNMAHISSTETAAYSREWIPSNQVEVATTVPNSAIIYGMVFEDTDGDGMQDAGESGIPNVSITLDGAITTTTDLNGNYTFSTTVAGTHTVVETDLAFPPPIMSSERYAGFGYMPNTFDFDPIVGGANDLPSYFSTTPNEVHVGATLGKRYQADFGDMLTNSGFASIHGTVFNDVNGNGGYDAGEAGIPGVTLMLDGDAVVTTGPYGGYTFSTAVAGPHTIVETDLGGYLSTTPNEVHVDVYMGNGYRVEFGDAPTSASFAPIYGAVFNDVNSNGVYDAGEAGIPGVTLMLDGDAVVTTGPYGGYTFSTAAGPHTIVETDLGGYLSTTPNEVHVEVTSGNSRRVDFGDVWLEGRTCDADIYEEDDSAAQAVTFVVNTSQAHQFCDDATDWIKFSAETNTVYTITTFSWGERADTFLALLDTDGHTLLAANDDYTGTTDHSSRIVWRVLADGVYYARITNQGGLTGDHTDYDLVIENGELSIIYLPIVMRDYSGGCAE